MAVTPDRIMQYGFGYAAPLILEAAVRHGVFDVLDRGPRSLGELQAATGASERGLRAILNALVGLELLTRDAEGRYALTPESAEFLVSHKPDFRGGMFRHVSTQLLPHWLHLTEAVGTGKPPIAVNREGQGASFFHDFVEALFPMNYQAARELADALKVAEVAEPVSVLDLAAGSGVWGIALAERSPQVRVTAVDWPAVIPVTRRVAERRGVGDRFRYVEGDLHTADFGTGHHVATLGHILHSEGAELGRALLKKTFAALRPGGTVAVAEFLVDEDRKGPARALIFGVNMLVHTEAGDTFSQGEIQGWLEEAGFGNVRALEVSGASPLILADR